MDLNQQKNDKLSPQNDLIQDNLTNKGQKVLQQILLMLLYRYISNLKS